MMREHVIHTPSGARVLMELGHGYAVVRPPFGPGVMSNSEQRLNVGHPATNERIVQSHDGTWITSRHLWAILVGLAKADQPLNVDEAARSLFWTAPDLHDRLMKLFLTFDPQNTYWQGMAKAGYYDPTTRLVHRVAA